MNAPCYMYMIQYHWFLVLLAGRKDKFCLNTSVEWPHHGNSGNNTLWRQWERAGMKGSKSVLWTNRKAVSLASVRPQRLHVSRFHHNIQVGLLPLIGQTSVLIPSHRTGQKIRPQWSNCVVDTPLGLSTCAITVRHFGAFLPFKQQGISLRCG